MRECVCVRLCLCVGVSLSKNASPFTVLVVKKSAHVLAFKQIRAMTLSEDVREWNEDVINWGDVANRWLIYILFLYS